MSSEKRASTVLESHTIDHVPLADRHGRPRDLFTLWFATNIAPLPIVTGAMAIQVFQLRLWWGISAIVLGHTLGAIVMALASAQGPRLGVPQMIQSRAQFGRYGSLVVVLLAVLIYFGFFISNIVLAGKSIHGVVEFFPLPMAIVIGVIGTGLIAILGYRVIHSINKVGTWVMGIGLLIGYAAILSQPLPSDFFSRGGFSFAGWVATFSLGVVWQISFTPYVSDYSRYLSPDVGIFRPFAFTCLGAALGTSLCFIFGALAVLAVPPGTEAMSAMRQATGPVGPAMMVLFMLSVVCHNALNLYGGVLSVVTSVQTFTGRWTPRVSVRVLIAGVVMTLCTLLALSVSSNFIGQFIDLILVLLTIMVPWAAINLTDFYLVRKGRYDIASLFQPDGGIYGRVNWKTLVVYGVGVAVQLPFITNPFFVGPLANLIEGADLSWLVGLLVTAPLYYAWEPSRLTDALLATQG